MSDFSKMTERYFREDLKISPLWGSDMGLEEYDDIMPDGGMEDIEATVEHDRNFLREVKSFENEVLTDDEKIDQQVLRSMLELGEFRHNELKLWARYPRSVDTVGNALYAILFRDSTPIKKRLLSIMKKMKKIPLFLENEKALLKNPVWLWTEMGIESCRRMKGFIDFIEDFGKTVTNDCDILNELHIDAINVKNAFKAHEQWLLDELPKTDKNFTMSEDKYNELLKKRLLPYSSKEILEIGYDYIKKINAEMKKTAAQIDSTATVMEVLQKIKKGHAESFEHVINDCKKVMREAREFVEKADFATLPKHEILEVVETPIFMRHIIPFAAYSPPGKFDADQKGIYMMTPPESNDDMLMEFCFEDLVSTSVHEAYPGHHLQLTCANLNPSTARIYAHATEFVEGWAHYCEDATAEAGFYNSPSAMLIRLKDMYWRAWRIVIDVELATGKMSFEDAVKHLVEDAGLEHTGAIGEVKRYTYTPGYQLSYLMGKHMIKELINDSQKKYGCTKKEIHDIMLNAGSLPITIMKNVIDSKLSKKEV